MSTIPRPRTWAWIGGWGIPVETFADAVRAAWPHDHHVLFAPDRHALERLRATPADFLAGYSLGALLLLSAEPWPATQSLVAVAPILAFDAEAGLGGTTPAATRELMRSKIDRKPEAMLALFQRLAGLRGLATTPLPCSHDDLVWGLDALGSLRARPANTTRARFYAGETDPLVASAQLRGHPASLHILPGLGHDFRELLPAAAPHERS